MVKTTCRYATGRQTSSATWIAVSNARFWWQDRQAGTVVQRWSAACRRRRQTGHHALYGRCWLESVRRRLAGRSQSAHQLSVATHGCKTRDSCRLRQVFLYQEPFPDVENLLSRDRRVSRGPHEFIQSRSRRSTVPETFLKTPSALEPFPLADLRRASTSCYNRKTPLRGGFMAEHPIKHIREAIRYTPNRMDGLS